MKRVMLLALLALALPTAALASSIEYKTGDFMSGTIKSNFTNPFFLQVVGSMNTIRLDTSALRNPSTSGACSASASLCTFASGSLTVTPAGATTPIFTSSLMAGTLVHTVIPGLNLVTVTATIPSSSTVGSGSIVTFTAFVNGGSLTSMSSATVVVTSPIPEPGTLGLLGTGVIALAGMTRRKLRLGS